MDERIWRDPLDERIVHEDLILAREKVLRIRDGRGLLVFVRMGTVWITQQGDRRDTIAEAGDWFKLDRDGLAVIYALRGASLTISAPLDVQPRWNIERATTLPLPGRMVRRTPARHSIQASLWAGWTRLRRLGAARHA